MLGFRHNSLEKDGAHSQNLEAYWLERKTYLRRVKRIPALRWRFARELAIYMLRRLLWSFGFFPVFISFWLQLVLNRFNPVAMITNLIPHLQAFVDSNPEQQASSIDTVLIAWLSIGFIFAVFDFVLTPFKSPYEYEADIHMRAWEEMQHHELQIETTADTSKNDDNAVTTPDQSAPGATNA